MASTGETSAHTNTISNNLKRLYFQNIKLKNEDLNKPSLLLPEKNHH